MMHTMVQVGASISLSAVDDTVARWRAVPDSHQVHHYTLRE